jgi:type IV secretory pathway VirB10-like protein
MISAIIGGVAYAQNIANPGTAGTYSLNNQQNLSASMASALGDSLGTMMQQVMQKYLNVSPTQVIREGYRFNVMVNKDLDFAAPYHPFDYLPGRN